MKRYATPFSRLQLGEQVEDRGLHRDVERRGRLVADDDLRVAGERARDRDALLQAARELRRALADQRGRRSGTEWASSRRRVSQLVARSCPSSIVSARPMMRRTERRRLSAESGFWKTIWTSLHLVAVALAERARERRARRARRPSPRRARSRPSSSRASVVLPLPDSPTSPSVSPAPSWKRDVVDRADVVPVLVERLAHALRAQDRRACRRSTRSTLIGSGRLRARQLLRLLVEVAAAAVAAAERRRGRAPSARQMSCGERAAVGEHAAGQLGAEPRQEARDRVELALRLASRRRAGCSAAGRPCRGGAGR